LFESFTLSMFMNVHGYMYMYMLNVFIMTYSTY
jgi:hypothetical protein